MVVQYDVPPPSCYVLWLYILIFYFLQLFKIMKEHKNPKVLSEGLLWMVSAVEDFGVSHLKLKVIFLLHKQPDEECFNSLQNYGLILEICLN